MNNISKIVTLHPASSTGRRTKIIEEIVSEEYYTLDLRLFEKWRSFTPHISLRRDIILVTPEEPSRDAVSVEKGKIKIVPEELEPDSIYMITYQGEKYALMKSKRGTIRFYDVIEG